VYVKTIEELFIDKRWGHPRARHIDVYACDECGAEHMTSHRAAHATSAALTFCSRDCSKRSRSSGKLAQKCVDVRVERYGVEYSSQVPGATEKMIVTRVERTGALAPSDPTSSSNVKFKQTMMERHGADHPSNAIGVKAKKLETYRERYGVDSPFSAGSPFRLSSEELRVAGQKGYRSTARQENGWIVSKPEQALVEFLRMRYGNVEQQALVEHGTRKCWLIDAYVCSIDTYVQLDGEFWHGLDKPYEDLHPTSKRAYDADRAQDEWFRTHGRRLVRITDKELIMCNKLNDWSTVLQRLEG